MNTQTYDKIWDGICKVAYETQRTSGGTTKFCPETKFELLEKYESLRDSFKHNYMLDSANTKVDHHKIAAFFIISVMEVEPLVNLHDKLRVLGEKRFFHNERLAIQVGLTILREYMNSKSGGNLHIGNFEFPKVSHGDDYIDNLCRELHYNKRMCQLSPFSIANELFLIEEYNRLLLSQTQAREAEPANA